MSEISEIGLSGLKLRAQGTLEENASIEPLDGPAEASTPGGLKAKTYRNKRP